MPPLAQFFSNHLIKPVAAKADADPDVVSLHWLCVEDENPEDPNKAPQKAAGAMVFIKGDENVRAFVAWAESQGFLPPEVLTPTKLYYYRNLDCHNRTWHVSGDDTRPGGGGVLEWCNDEADAKERMSIMSKFPQFTGLEIGKWD